MMEYKGYVAIIGYDASDDLLHGHVINAAPYPIATFTASDVAGLKREFRLSIEEYMASCEEDGFEPERPFPGKLELPLYRGLHQRVSLAAHEDGLEIDEWVIEAIEQKLTGKRFPPPSSIERAFPTA